jgi:hypothetical protein
MSYVVYFAAKVQLLKGLNFKKLLTKNQDWRFCATVFHKTMLV